MNLDIHFFFSWLNFLHLNNENDNKTYHIGLFWDLREMSSRSRTLCCIWNYQVGFSQRVITTVIQRDSSLDNLGTLFQKSFIGYKTVLRLINNLEIQHGLWLSKERPYLFSPLSSFCHIWLRSSGKINLLVSPCWHLSLSVQALGSLGANQHKC